MLREKFPHVLLLTIAALCAATPAVAAEKPNILFIFADDWGWVIFGCHGHPYVKTPNIDRLTKQGTDFQRFTVASGVCSPSRTAVMTGRFPARFNIDGHFAWVPSNARRNMPDWLDPETHLLSRFLQKAGYRTAHYGKWHLANDMIPDSPTPAAYGFDEYGAFNCSGEQMPWHEDAERASAFIKTSVEEKKPSSSTCGCTNRTPRFTRCQSTSGGSVISIGPTRSTLQSSRMRTIASEKFSTHSTSSASRRTPW